MIGCFFVTIICDCTLGREDPWTLASKDRFFPTIFQSGWRKPSHSSWSPWWVRDHRNLPKGQCVYGTLENYLDKLNHYSWSETDTGLLCVMFCRLLVRLLSLMPSLESGEGLVLKVAVCYTVMLHVMGKMRHQLLLCLLDLFQSCGSNMLLWRCFHKRVSCFSMSDNERLNKEKLNLCVFIRTTSRRS